MKENANIRYRMLGYALLLIVASGSIVYFVNEILLEEAQWNTNYLLITAFLTLVLLIYCLVMQKQLFATLGKTLFSGACFVIAALVLFLLEFYVNTPAWVIGGILAAALIDRSLGLLYLYFFTFQAIYLQGGSLKGLVLHFLIATAICIIIPKMKSWLSMLYMMVVIGCMVVIAAFVMNRMEFQQDMVLEALPIFGIYMGSIFVAMLLRVWGAAGNGLLLKEEQPETVSEDMEGQPEAASEEKEGQLEAVSEGKEKQPEAVSEDMEGQCLSGIADSEAAQLPAEAKDYTAYCDESSELLLQLKEHSKPAYLHSKLVAKMSGEAAEKIQADASLVRAAALHHEIGKLKGGDAAGQTLALLREHGFPDEILEILKAYEAKENVMLQSKEAVILLLADKIVSMYRFLRKTGKQTPPEKIVDQTIAMQMLRGEWNESGLSIAECTTLRNYFVEQLTEQDRKRGEKA